MQKDNSMSKLSSRNGQRMLGHCRTEMIKFKARQKSGQTLQKSRQGKTGADPGSAV